MSEPQPASQNSNAPPAVIPNSATNGNGRSLERSTSQQFSQAVSAPPSAASNNSNERAERGEKSKVSGSNNQSKGYMRRPMNKK